MQYPKNIIYLELKYKVQPSQTDPQSKTKAESGKETKALGSLVCFKLIGYANSNYISNPKYKKSVISSFFFIYRVIASYCSKKPCIISTSTTKAEYIALEYAV